MIQPGLYLITDEAAPFASTVDLLQKISPRHLSLVQYRRKLCDATTFQEAKILSRICRQLGIPFIVNDHLEVAVQCNADGVHLGGQDTPTQEARMVLGPDAIVGLSITNTAETVDTTHCSYLGVGPIFPTPSKKDAAPPLGLAKLASLSQRMVGIPIYAIGGLNVSHAVALAKIGIHGMAAISMLYNASNPNQVAATCSAAWQRKA